MNVGVARVAARTHLLMNREGKRSQMPLKKLAATDEAGNAKA
jgi:hypothetical protein